MTSSASFLAELAPGDLVFANNIAARKMHLVELDETAYDADVQALRGLGKKARAARIAEIDPERRRMWSAAAICGVSGQQSAWGNTTTYYWHPEYDPDLRNACQGCLGEWQRRKKPTIRGWEQSGDAGAPWPWPLPFGWHEVPAGRHPWEVAESQATESVRNDAGRVVGRPEVELRRFLRGDRIVRLTRTHRTDTYYARHWRIGAGPQSDGATSSGSLRHAQRACHALMARGGY